MKKLFYHLAIALAALAFTACNNDKPDDPDAIPVSGVEFTDAPTLLEIGQEITVTWNVTPVDATNKDVDIASDKPAIASITSAGVLKGLAQGTAVITITTIDGLKKDTFTVQVVEHIVPVTGLTLNVTGTRTAARGDEFYLIATVTPDDATNKEITWSYDESIARIAPDPDDATKTMLTVLDGGTTTVTATTVGKDASGNSLTASFTLQATAPVQGISFVNEDGTDLIAENIDAGRETVVNLQFTPAGATNKNYTVVSGNTQLVTVAKDATDPLKLILTGVKKSNDVCVITVTTAEGNFKDDLNVTVRQPVTEITLTPAEENPSMYPGGTCELTVGFPDDPNNKAYTVTSANNAVATAAIDTTDPMKVIVTGGNTPGNTQITVKSSADDTKTASVTVTVKEVTGKVQSISMPATATVDSRGATTELTVTFNPSDAENQNLTVSSSDTNAATAKIVGGKVVVTGVKAGQTTLTVTAADTSLGTKTTTCDVTVNAAAAPKLGTATFRSTQTWTLGNYVWSDFVTGTACQKDTFAPAYASSTATTNITDENCDCRWGQFKNGTDGERYYDIFSTAMIYYYADVLCPDGWRLPVKAEFDSVSASVTGDAYTFSTYESEWGGELGGWAKNTGTLALNEVGTSFKVGGMPFTGSNSTNRIYMTAWSSGSFATGGNSQYKNAEGLGVRCVKNK